MPESLEQMLLRHEGFRAHVYKCPAGYDTIGVGRNIEKDSGPGITQEEAMYLLSNDIKRVRALLNRHPVYTGLDEVRRMALENMCFQLGYNGLLDFKLMWLALGRGDWEEAAKEALDSKWARQDSPGRA